MRLLLDSHVALWWLADAAELGPRTRATVADADSVYFSSVTPWELGIKRALGKLDLPDGMIDALVDSGFDPLAISAAHGEAAAALPAHHRDPFDRMLIAQAQHETLIIVSADRSFDDYEVERLDART